MQQVWDDIFTATPRESFVPDLIWVEGAGGHKAVSRAEQPDLWAKAVASDDPVVTQVDDGTTEPGGTPELVTSSSSARGVVRGMLERLDLHPGMRVLEIGTGTGWNAALLARRVGDNGAVVTIEIDPAIAEHAASRLKAAGCHDVTIITGDGSLGWPATAPYDRVIATAAVQRVPYEWVRQTAPGGVILTPFRSEYRNGALLSLQVGDDDTASGRIVDTSAFMAVRSQRPASDPLASIVNPAEVVAADRSATTLHPYEPTSHYDGSFVVGLLVPSCRLIVESDPAGDPQDYAAWFIDPGSGSWALLKHERGAKTFPVRQHGPRRLWDEVEQAHTWWTQAGRPEMTRFGVTVTAGSQHVWLDEPHNAVPTWRAHGKP